MSTSILLFLASALATPVEQLHEDRDPIPGFPVARHEAPAAWSLGFGLASGPVVSGGREGSMGRHIDLGSIEAQLELPRHHRFSLQWHPSTTTKGLVDGYTALSATVWWSIAFGDDPVRPVLGSGVHAGSAWGSRTPPGSIEANATWYVADVHHRVRWAGRGGFEAEVAPRLDLALYMRPEVGIGFFGFEVIPAVEVVAWWRGRRQEVRRPLPAHVVPFRSR